VPSLTWIDYLTWQEGDNVSAIVDKTIKLCGGSSTQESVVNGGAEHRDQF
jgi:hypothetical protein